MSKAEVESILGPPGDYSTGPRAYFEWLDMPLNDAAMRMSIETRYLSPDEVRELFVESTWTSDDVTVTVFFSKEQVYGGMCLGTVPSDEGPFGSLLGRAKRLWRGWFG
jgi:hypothetical protein